MAEIMPPDGNKYISMTSVPFRNYTHARKAAPVNGLVFYRNSAAKDLAKHGICLFKSIICSSPIISIFTGNFVQTVIDKPIKCLTASDNILT